MQHSVQDFIREAGSPSELADMLGLERKRGVWRISQWLKRGIPARVQLDHAVTFRKLSQRIARKACGQVTQ